MKKTVLLSIITLLASIYDVSNINSLSESIDNHLYKHHFTITVNMTRDQVDRLIQNAKEENILISLKTLKYNSQGKIIKIEGSIKRRFYSGRFYVDENDNFNQLDIYVKPGIKIAIE